jgi:hypothetical protein
MDGNIYPVLPSVVCKLLLNEWSIGAPAKRQNKLQPLPTAKFFAATVAAQLHYFNTENAEIGMQCTFR